MASVVATEATELLALQKADFERLLGTTLDKIISHEVAKRDKQREETATPTIAWGDLDVRQVLGEGSFGSVRLTVHTKTKTPYALKAMHKGHLIATNQVNNTVNEKRIMQECEHPFILTCAAAFHDRTHVKLLLGLALGGELFTRMSKVGTLRTKDTALYVAMVASALGFLTSRNIAHRDLKLENLMFDEKGYLKLVDFGFAKVIDGRTFTFCGTPDYLAPEILGRAALPTRAPPAAAQSVPPAADCNQCPPRLIAISAPRGSDWLPRTHAPHPLAHEQPPHLVSLMIMCCARACAVVCAVWCVRWCAVCAVGSAQGAHVRSRLVDSGHLDVRDAPW